MKKLILVRHAKSDWHSAAATDFERPLNSRGKKAAPLMGQRLADRGSHADLLLSSPAKRARQTARKIAAELGYSKDCIQYEEKIYEAGVEVLVEMVKDLDDAYGNVIMFGHNPGFSELGEWFTADAPDWLPTCGLLELELPIESWSEISKGCAKLVRYDYPKKPL